MNIDFKNIINFIKNNSYYILFFMIGLIILSIISFIFVSYAIIKLLQYEIDNNSILFYDYNKHEKNMLNLYGDCKIEHIYIVKQPLHILINLALNIFTFYRYNEIIKEKKEYFPYHTQFIINIRLKNGEQKLLLLEKNNSVSLMENFTIHSNKKMLRINIKKKKLTLNKLLDDTIQRIGNEKFFNWHIYKNNCQKFSREILITLNKLTKGTDNFIYEDKILKKYTLSEFTLHTINCLCVVLNIFEKYIYYFF